MKNRIKVLNILTSLDPKYGGPARGAIDSSITLSNQGFKVNILTGDIRNSNFFKSKKIKIENQSKAEMQKTLHF